MFLKYVLVFFVPSSYEALECCRFRLHAVGLPSAEVSCEQDLKCGSPFIPLSVFKSQFSEGFVACAGKYTIAYVETGGEKEYMLASACDELYVPPGAYLSLRGLSVSVSAVLLFVHGGARELLAQAAVNSGGVAFAFLPLSQFSSCEGHSRWQ